MLGWKLYLRDSYNRLTLIENPQFVPRIGDRVHFGYTPAPKVNEVAISYEDKSIFVQCD